MMTTVTSCASCARFVCLISKCRFQTPASCKFFSVDSPHHPVQQQPGAKQLELEYKQEPPDYPARDWIGPVDKRSNLRQVCFAQPQDETETERRHRETREEIYRWNHDFWAQHNQNFIEAKERFVKKALGRKGVGPLDEDGAKRVLSPDEMAEFYREFLQDNQHTLRQYNRQWYRKNTALLWPGLKIAVRRLFKR